VKSSSAIPFLARLILQYWISIESMFDNQKSCLPTIAVKQPNLIGANGSYYTPVISTLMAVFTTLFP